MEDYISRQKLIEELDNLSLSVEVWTSMKPSEIVKITIEAYRNYVMETINSQSPADQWIPCSEREPEDPCIYTVEDCSLYTVNKFGSPQRYVWKVLPPMFGTNYRLVAWKPVDPEPYKGVE